MLAQLVSKTRLKTALWLALAAFCAEGQAFAANSEWKPGTYMSQAVARVVATGAVVDQADSNFGWAPGLCLLGGFLEQRQTVSFGFYLEAGHKYVFVGGGDNDVTDLDLYLYSGSTKLTSDQDIDANPVLSFTPTRSGTYSLRVHMYGASTASFAAVGVLSDHGYSVPIRNLTDASVKSLQNSMFYNENRGGATFHAGANQWSLYGWIIRPGATETIETITLENRTHTFHAAGDTTTSDLDLEVVNNSDKSVIARDSDGDAIPAVHIQGAGTVDLRVKNHTSRGASLVLATVLDTGTRNSNPPNARFTSTRW